jgi:transposase-like protein
MLNIPIRLLFYGPLVDTERKSPSVGQRREWPEALKRQMVAETLEPGVAVELGMTPARLRNERFKLRRRLRRSSETFCR